MTSTPNTAKTPGAPEFTAFQVAASCGGHVVVGHPGTVGRGVCRDTRTLEPGQVFFALAGERHDAHAFLDRAVEGGASVLVVERLPQTPVPLDGLAIVQVPNTTTALLDLARAHRNHLQGRVVAITGSYGKTTTKEMLAAILQADHSVTAAPASYNNRIGVALTLLSARHDDDFVVLELGMNHPGEIDELAEAAAPEMGAITAVAEVHLEGVGSLEGVREAKAEIIPHLPPRGVLALNADNEQCMMLADRHPGPVLTFGTGEDADLRVADLRPLGDGWSFRALGRQFLLPVGGRYNVMNAAAALLLARELGIDAETAREALAQFRLPGLRYQREQIGGVDYVQDCYNSNPCAMRAAAESFSAEPAGGRRIVVCGDMLELGESAPRLHREMGEHLAACDLDALVAVGQMADHVLIGWKMAAPARTGLAFSSAEDAWPALFELARPGDAVLVKGSRGMRLETMLDEIRKRTENSKREVA
jgi:UDP-N-acetylmuramoyl-tripeptide--D-alanyl-D-alanine ligase